MAGLRPMDKAQRRIRYDQVLDACALEGCPICRLRADSARRHIDAVIYDGVNDIPLRSQLRLSQGYCREHSWQLPDAGGSAPLGIAIIHRDVLHNFAQSLQKTKFNQAIGNRLRAALAGSSEKVQFRSDSRLEPQGPCPACANAEVIERLSMEATMEVLGEDDLRMVESLRASDGLCLPHLRQALSMARNKTAYDHMVSITLEQLADLVGNLDEFVRKHDHRYRKEAMTARERLSWQSALQRLVGPPHMKVDQETGKQRT